MRSGTGTALLAVVLGGSGVVVEFLGGAGGFEAAEILAAGVSNPTGASSRKCPAPSTRTYVAALVEGGAPAGIPACTFASRILAPAQAASLPLPSSVACCCASS